jgi:hypothetical protein
MDLALGMKCCGICSTKKVSNPKDVRDEIARMVKRLDELKVVVAKNGELKRLAGVALHVGDPQLTAARSQLAALKLKKREIRERVQERESPALLPSCPPALLPSIFQNTYMILLSPHTHTHTHTHTVRAALVVESAVAHREQLELVGLEDSALQMRERGLLSAAVVGGLQDDLKGKTQVLCHTTVCILLLDVRYYCLCDIYAPIAAAATGTTLCSLLTAHCSPLTALCSTTLYPIPPTLCRSCTTSACATPSRPSA